VIAQTAMAMKGDRETCCWGGLHSKPIDPEVWLSFVKIQWRKSKLSNHQGI